MPAPKINVGDTVKVTEPSPLHHEASATLVSLDTIPFGTEFVVKEVYHVDGDLGTDDVAGRWQWVIPEHVTLLRRADGTVPQAEQDTTLPSARALYDACFALDIPDTSPIPAHVLPVARAIDTARAYLPPSEDED